MDIHNSNFLKRLPGKSPTSLLASMENNIMVMDEKTIVQRIQSCF